MKKTYNLETEKIIFDKQYWIKKNKTSDLIAGKIWNLDLFSSRKFCSVCFCQSVP